MADATIAELLAIEAILAIRAKRPKATTTTVVIDSKRALQRITNG